MIIPVNSADKALGVHLNKVNKVQSTTDVAQISGGDVVTISNFSSLLEKATACAMSQPDIRTDVVAKAKADLAEGKLASGEDIASSLINRAVEGQV